MRALLLGSCLFAGVAAVIASQCRPSGSLDLRVTKALGAHGYESARVSVITSGRPVEDPRLTYSEQFRYRWTEMAVSTGLVTGLRPGMNELRIGDATACVRLPPLGEGIRGVIFGDPCTGTFGVKSCLPQASSTWQVEARLTQLLNSAAAGPEPLDFWTSVGDNFYDVSGNSTKSFYDKLEPAVKSTFMTTVVGNGDFWPGTGTPDKVTCIMPFGYGFLQWYAQDTLAAKKDPKAPFDFSVVPPDPHSDVCQRDEGFTAAASNYFFYHVLGNVGFIGFTGHASFESQEESFQEACEYFQAQAGSLQEVVLLGHWSGQDHGCPARGGADTGSAQRLLRRRFAGTPCGRAKAFYGHTHCNEREGWDCGELAGSECFQIGAGGVGDPKCEPHWGVLYFDTTNGTGLTYFQLGNATSDLSGPLMECLRRKSLGGCTEHGVAWLGSEAEVASVLV